MRYWPLQPYLKCQTCKVDGRAEGQTGRKESGEKNIAAVARTPEAFVRAIPGTLCTLDSFWFTYDVIPHDL